ncbi:MAG: phytase [Steroidobacteraceae bacterium]
MKANLGGLAAALAVLLAGCGAAGPHAAQSAVSVDQEFPVSQGTPSGAVLWLHPADPARSLMVAAAGNAGLTLQGLDGQARGGFSGFVADAIALSFGFDAGAGEAPLLIVHDRGAAALRGFSIDPRQLALHELTPAPLPLRAELTGLCLYRSTITGKTYAFAATDPGQLQQWELSWHDNALQGRLVRDIAVGAGASYCVADENGHVVYVADEATGIWRIAAEPEADLAARSLLDLTAPRGRLGPEVKGLALRHSAGATYLLAVDEDAAAVHVYTLPDGRHAGQFGMAGVDGSKFESLWTGFAPAPREAGLVLVADEGGAAPAVRALRWDSIAAALKLPADAAADPRSVVPVSVHRAEPAIETEPVEDYGDAADDPAIWVHPADPARSLIIGAQKKRGIEVYDLEGRRLQTLAVGRTNNVDLRQGVLIAGRRRDIVAGSNRDDRTLTLYEVDAATRRLSDAAAAPIPTGLRDPYGLCMYHSAKSGKLYVFINNPDAGEFRQWEIVASGAKLSGQLVREFTVGTQAEGCTADDETGALYIAEEDVGLWRYAAEPDGGTQRRAIDTVASGRLEADVEGVAVFKGRQGAGYVVLSNQGHDNYAVYRREGDNAFIGYFTIVANDQLGIDGASETDGLEVTSAPLGAAFPHGLLVVQDGRNITPVERQNFKLVPWERVAAALELPPP